MLGDVPQFESTTVVCASPRRWKAIKKICNCPGCREAHAIYMRHYRRYGSSRKPAAPKRVRGKLALCWCESGKMKVIPAADVQAGKTWSCGAEGCHP